MTSRKYPLYILGLSLRRKAMRWFMFEMHLHQFSKQRRACYEHLCTQLLLDRRTQLTKKVLSGVAAVQAGLRGHMGHFPSQPLSRQPWSPPLLTTCITCHSSRYPQSPSQAPCSNVPAVLCQLLLAVQCSCTRVLCCLGTLPWKTVYIYDHIVLLC